MSDAERPDWMTAAWASDVLGHDVQSLSTMRIGDGLVGMNLRVVVTYFDPNATGPRSVVVKLPSPDATSRATGVAMRNYEREVCFYRDIASTVDMRVAACHHAQWSPETGDFVLVLEDLAPGRQGDQIAGCSIDQARTAIARAGAPARAPVGRPFAARTRVAGPPDRRRRRGPPERAVDDVGAWIPGHVLRSTCRPKRSI